MNPNGDAAELERVGGGRGGASAAGAVAITGESVAEAVVVALRERLARIRASRDGRPLAAQLMEIGRRCSRRAVLGGEARGGTTGASAAFWTWFSVDGWRPLCERSGEEGGGQAHHVGTVR